MFSFLPLPTLSLGATLSAALAYFVPLLFIGLSLPILRPMSRPLLLSSPLLSENRHATPSGGFSLLIPRLFLSFAFYFR
ncbi:hypothetical protein M407DRAFT_240685 [Tulasnella calospora MUT 4182]|uniref:Uncharacterized protein n=1 Tax=Tulasnella calospora MUT 4182 TaxID=1051891 RepID=A0A0C3ML11_9AGAM|nr:hypothetical protein M407DRAFT_240685 [Tulasnella calospora MUT 4182]